VFAVGGDGEYRVRAMHVDDLARLCLAKGVERQDSVTDAVGPERPTFNELIATVRAAVGSRSRVIHVPGAVMPVFSRALGLVLHDVLLTREEFQTMAQGMADTDGPATGPTALSAWVAEHSAELGLHYANELRRHF
jgi:NADH dehydrogenase